MRHHAYANKMKIKYLDQIAFLLEFGIKEKNYFIICQIWEILPVKDGKKNYCLTSCYVNQQIRSYLGNTLKNRAAITSVPATTTVLS